MKAPLTRFACATALLVVASYAFISLSGPRGISAWMEKQRLIHSLEKRNGDLNKDIGRTRDRIGRLANDPDERERVARERLNVVEKRDKVYVTGDPTPKKPAGR